MWSAETYRERLQARIEWCKAQEKKAKGQAARDVYSGWAEQAAGFIDKIEGGHVPDHGKLCAMCRKEYTTNPSEARFCPGCIGDRAQRKATHNKTTI